MINSGMTALCLGRRLALAMVLGLALLLAGLTAVGVGVQYGVVVPPDVDVNVTQGMYHFLAYHTHAPDCPPRTPCSPESAADQTEYYVVWSIFEPATLEQPYGRTARRLLAIQLKRISKSHIE